VLAAGGAIDAAVAALEAHVDNAEVQENGLRLLAHFTHSDEGAAAVLAAGSVIAAAVAALEAEVPGVDLSNLLLNIPAVDLVLSGAVQALFRARPSDELRRHARTAAKKHHEILRASLRLEHPPGLLESARNATLTLLYLGNDDAVKTGFAAAGAGLRQLRRALAADTPATRLSGARAIAHLLERMEVSLQPPPAAAGGAGADSSGTAIHSFAAVFDSEENSDFCFEVEGHTLHAHRVLLENTLGTDVFAAMLSHDTADSLTGRVKVRDVSFEVFSLVVRFLYTGKAEVPSELLPAVFRAARRWMVGKLVALCAAQLSARCLRAVPPGGGEQDAADRWEGMWKGMWEMLDLVAEDPGGDATECLELAASRFMLRHVEALVEQDRFLDNRAQIAEQLLEHAYPAFLRISISEEATQCQLCAGRVQVEREQDARSWDTMGAGSCDTRCPSTSYI
jgi:hypothetical protein